MQRLFLTVENLLLIKLHLSYSCYGRYFTLGTIEFFVIRNCYHLPIELNGLLLQTHIFILLWLNIPVAHIFWTCVWDIPWATSVILLCSKTVFPLLLFFFFSCLFSNFLSLFGCIRFSVFRYPLLHCFEFFFSFTLISPQFALSISGLWLCTALGIKSDSLQDWMRVAMACCIWKAIHSAGTLQFNLKQDWCWQTSHPLSSKMFPPLPTSIADRQRAYATL